MNVKNLYSKRFEALLNTFIRLDLRKIDRQNFEGVSFGNFRIYLGIEAQI